MSSQTAAAPRTDRLIDTGLEFSPGDPVLVRVTQRGHRISVSDDGAAVVRAGLPPGWNTTARRISDELVVNIGRSGTVSLPVVPVGPPQTEVIRRIGAASLALYQELLELAL
jgi:hypothetical protein